MRTTLNKAEKKYIISMYAETVPKIRKITDIKQLPLGCAALFLENRQEQPKEVWPLDHSITEKYLSAYGLPLNTTYKQWERWLKKQETLHLS